MKFYSVFLKSLSYFDVSRKVHVLVDLLCILC